MRRTDRGDQSNLHLNIPHTAPLPAGKPNNGGITPTINRPKPAGPNKKKFVDCKIRIRLDRTVTLHVESLTIDDTQQGNPLTALDQRPSWHIDCRPSSPANHRTTSLVSRPECLRQRSRRLATSEIAAISTIYWIWRSRFGP